VGATGGPADDATRWTITPLARWVAVLIVAGVTAWGLYEWFVDDPADWAPLAAAGLTAVGACFAFVIRIEVDGADLFVHNGFMWRRLPLAEVGRVEPMMGGLRIRDTSGRERVRAFAVQKHDPWRWISRQPNADDIARRLMQLAENAR